MRAAKAIAMPTGRVASVTVLQDKKEKNKKTTEKVYDLQALYLTGAGVPRDNGEAARWLRVSAEAGDQAAQADLGNLVLKGAGAADDPVRIARWFEQAASAGGPHRRLQPRRLLSQGGLVLSETSNRRLARR